MVPKKVRNAPEIFFDTSIISTHMKPKSLLTQIVSDISIIQPNNNAVSIPQMIVFTKSKVQLDKEIKMKIYLNDVGTQFQIDTGVDITTAAITDIIVKKPDASIATWKGTVDKVDPKLKNILLYSAGIGDFDQVGTYICQANIVFTNWSGRGETFTFQVNNWFI